MTVQNHIHLSTTLQVSGEKAPDQSWKVHDRVLQPLVFVSVRYSKRGNLLPNVLQSGGSPLLKTNFQYEIRARDDGTYTAEQNAATLMAMIGKTVYLVDNVHCDDGQDHTAFVRTMFFSNEGISDGFKTDHLGLQFYFIRVNLLDASS